MTIKVKRILLTAILLTINLGFSTSSLDGTVVFGYFDNDVNIDMFTCNKESSYMNDKMLTKCDFHLKKSSVPLNISDNYGCKDISLYPIVINYKLIKNYNYEDLKFENTIPGEFILDCSISGYNSYLHYKYDKDLNNWFLFKKIISFDPNGPNDPLKDDIVLDNIKEQISFDKKIVKYNNYSNLLQLENYLKRIFEKKEKSIYFDDKNHIKQYLNHHLVFNTKKEYIQALLKSIDISNLDINQKNINNYKKIAYYLEQLNAHDESVLILNQINEYDANKRVLSH